MPNDKPSDYETREAYEREVVSGLLKQIPPVMELAVSIVRILVDAYAQMGTPEDLLGWLPAIRERAESEFPQNLTGNPTLNNSLKVAYVEMIAVEISRIKDNLTRAH